MGPALTTGPRRTSFSLLRGHLSRPACSHVKQLAKQAGDKSDPGPSYSFRPDFLWPDFRGSFESCLKGIGIEMVKVQSVPNSAIHADERSQEADHPSSKIAQFGVD